MQCEIKKIKLLQDDFGEPRDRSQCFSGITMSWGSFGRYAKESIKQQIEGELSRFFNIFLAFLLSLMPLWAYSFNKCTNPLKICQQYEMSVFAASVLRSVSDFASVH